MARDESTESDATVTAVRQKNFQWLFKQFKDDWWSKWPADPEKGMLKHFAARLGLSPRYLSHLNNDRKGIGHATARSIEASLKLPEGWMDKDHDGPEPANDQEKQIIEIVLQCFRESPVETQAALLALLKGRVVSGLVRGGQQEQGEKPIGIDRTASGAVAGKGIAGFDQPPGRGRQG